VEARSEGQGQGSEFCIRLAALPERETPTGREPPTGKARREPRRRILVVDDNFDAAESIARILKLFGHEVRCVQDGPNALAAARDYRPEVVVLDIGLPGMDGYEVARRLRRMDLPATRIVAVTGYGQDEDRLRSRAAGFDEHLTKPVDPEVLQSFVAACG
jgi:CheY-like chemotaxis protein